MQILFIFIKSLYKSEDKFFKKTYKNSNMSKCNLKMLNALKNIKVSKENQSKKLYLLAFYCVTIILKK